MQLSWSVVMEKKNLLTRLAVLRSRENSEQYWGGDLVEVGRKNQDEIAPWLLALMLSSLVSFWILMVQLLLG